MLQKQHELRKPDSRRPKNVPTHSRKHPVPSEFGTLMSLINQVPDGLRPLNDLRKLAASLPELHVLIFQETKNLPRKLKERLGMSSPDLSNAQWRLGCFGVGGEKQRNEYDVFVQGRSMLTVMAQENAHKNIGPFHLETWLEADDKGLLRAVQHPLLACVEGVEIDRICRCPICEKFYWAERIDQPTCSKRCNNVRRSKIQRGTYVESRPRCLKKQSAKSKGK